MALLTWKQAAAELGFRSTQSLRSRVAQGQLKVVYLDRLPGAKRDKGAPRFDSDEIARLKRRICGETPADPVAPTEAAAGSSEVITQRTARHRSKLKNQRPKKFRHYD